MKRILIIGITGFVGTNLVRYFEGDEGIQIIGYSRDTKKAKSKFKDLDFLPEISAALLDRYLIDTVIHLAGIAHDLSGNYQKEDYLQVNYQWTAEIYNEFLRSSVDRFIFISSIKAVADYADQVIDENFDPNPTSDYGISKRMAEEYILAHQRSNKKSYILKPCMIHGPGNKGNLNILYKTVKSGIPYPLAAFNNQRSFLSIENFCFVVNEILCDRLKYGEYLLADNETISTLELVKLIGQVVGKRIRIIKIPKAGIKLLAKIGSLVRAPFNKVSLSKLIENMKVSNKKLLLNLSSELPISTREGLIKTINSFDE